MLRRGSQCDGVPPERSPGRRPECGGNLAVSRAPSSRSVPINPAGEVALCTEATGQSITRCHSHAGDLANDRASSIVFELGMLADSSEEKRRFLAEARDALGHASWK